MAIKLSTRKTVKPQSTRDISNPVLISANVLPRDDLQYLNDIPATRGTSQNPSPLTSQKSEVPERQQWNPTAQDNSRQQCDENSSSSHTRGGVSKEPMSLSLQRKPSKWRKIGGIFTAKNAVKPTLDKKPIYQVRVNDRSSHDLSNSTDFHCEQKPRYMVPPKLNSQQKGRTEQQSTGQSSKPKESGSEPFLNVDIPQVELERYSVMFSGLLDKRRPPPLARRRSRTLDDLNTSMTNEFFTDPPKLRRQATSPAPRSPNFASFPASHFSKPSEDSGNQNLSPCPSPSPKLPTVPEGRTGNETLRQNRIHHTGQNPDVSTSHQAQISVAYTVDSNESKRDHSRPRNGTEGAVATREKKVNNRSSENLPTATLRTRSVVLSETLDQLNGTRKRDHQNTVPLFTASKERVDQIMAAKMNSSSTSPAETTHAQFKATKDRVDQIMGAKSNRSETSRVNSNRRPHENKHTDGKPPKSPKAEVSIARSVSVTRAKKQVIVPIGPRPTSGKSNQRFMKGMGGLQKS